MRSPFRQTNAKAFKKHGDKGNENERCTEVFPKRLLIPLPKAHGKQRAASHTQAKDDGGQKGHQRKGRADRRQRIAPKKLPDDQRVGDVIALLQEIAQKSWGMANSSMDLTTGPFVRSRFMVSSQNERYILHFGIIIVILKR